MAGAGSSTPRLSLPGGLAAAAKLIVAYYRKNGTLPTVAAMRDSDEEQLYRALKRIRLLKRQGLCRKLSL
jgi:hypothetical protein